MKRVYFNRIRNILVLATLCVAVLLVLGNTTSTFAMKIVTPEHGYYINLSEAVKVGDTYWFTKDKNVEIEADPDYEVSVSADGDGSSRLVYTYGMPLPEVVYSRSLNEQVEIRLPKLAWDGDTPTALFTPGSSAYVTGLTTSVEYTIPTRETGFWIDALDENGSGVKSIAYYVADASLTGETASQEEAIMQIEAGVGSKWTLVEGSSASGTLPYYGSNVIYAKIEDYAGNEVYLNSTGIVLFEQPSVSTTSVEYTKQGTTDPTFELDLPENLCVGDIILKDASGNTVNGFTEREDMEDTSWGYSNGDGVVTLNREFLDDLSTNGMEETYTVVINYLPLAEQYPNLDTSSVYMEAFSSEVELTVKLNWGERKPREDGVVQYVDNAGKTSVEVCSSSLSNNTLWLSESLNGMKSWYGMDLSENAFALDQAHRFYVKCLGDTEADYIRYYNQLDDSVRSTIDTTKNMIFQIGVEKTDGSKIQPQNGKVDIYVQLDDGWDINKVRARYINSNEQVPISFEEKTDPSGVTDTYAILELQHFSPYIIYQQKEGASVPPTYYYPIYNVPTTTEPESADNHVTSNKVKDTEETETLSTEPTDIESTEDIKPEEDQDVSNEQMDSDSTNGKTIDGETEENGLEIGVYLIGAIIIALLLFGWMRYKKKN